MYYVYSVDKSDWEFFDTIHNMLCNRTSYEKTTSQATCICVQNL